MDIDKIKEDVLNLGACRYAPDLMRADITVSEAISLMLQPECLEFCMEKDYPKIDIMKKYEHELINQGVFISGEHECNKRKIVIFGGDVKVNIKGFDISEIYVRGGSVHIVAEENSFAIVENWGGLVLHEGNVKVIDKI